MDPLRWQSWHFSCKIGAISLANVGSAASEVPDSVKKTPQASASIPRFRRTRNLASLIAFPFLSSRLVVYLYQNEVSKVGGSPVRSRQCRAVLQQPRPVFYRSH